MQDQPIVKVRGGGVSVPMAGRVYLQHETSTELFDCQNWYYRALADFSERLNDDGFPCLFARKAWKAGSIRFLFCDHKKKRNYQDFHAGLVEYTTFVQHTSLNDRLFAPLVVFFDNQFTRGMPQQHPVAWDALNWIHIRDLAPWPENIPLDPDDPEWCFCFNGVPLFINISTADHKILHSRNLGHNLTLVINPRENFDSVASVYTRSGRLIREQIRSRIAVYNDGVVPIELGFYGKADNLEWKQYQLDEYDLEKPLRCPFSINNNM